PLRRSSLHQYGPTLRRTRNIQGPRNSLIFALKIDLVNLVGVGVAARFAIEQERVIFPTVPELSADLHVFFGHRVANFVARHLIEAEILRALMRGDNVPTSATLADVVESRKLPCNCVGQREGG